MLPPLCRCCFALTQFGPTLTFRMMGQGRGLTPLVLCLTRSWMHAGPTQLNLSAVISVQIYSINKHVEEALAALRGSYTHGLGGGRGAPALRGERLHNIPATSRMFQLYIMQYTWLAHTCSRVCFVFAGQRSAYGGWSRATKWYRSTWTRHHERRQV